MRYFMVITCLVNFNLVDRMWGCKSYYDWTKNQIDGNLKPGKQISVNAFIIQAPIRSNLSCMPGSKYHNGGCRKVF